MNIVQTEFSFKKFMAFTLPITLQVLLRNMVGITDNVMVGILGPDYMAALRIATSYLFFFIVLLVAFSNAGSIIAGQLWGKGDKKGFYNICGATIFLSAIVSIILGLVMYFGSNLSISIMINDPTIIKYGSEYMRIIAASFVFNGLSIAISVIFTSQGDTQTPFYQQIIITIINLVLNYFLIFGKFGFPQMGVAGAAWASLISSISGLIYIILRMIRLKKNPDLKSVLKPHIKELKEIFHIGLPVLGDMFFWQFAMMVYLKFIGMAGSEAVAIYGVIGLFFSILFLTVSGFVSGTSIYISQILGAGKPEKAMAFGYKALWSGMIIGAISGLVVILFAFWVPSLFKLTGNAAFHCTICLIILGFRQPFATACGILPSAIRAGKDTKFPFFTSFITFIAIGLPLTFLAGPFLKLGMIGIFIAMSIEEMSKAVIFFARYRTGKWIKKSNEPLNNFDSEEMVQAGLINN